MMDIKAESLPWQFKLVGVLLIILALALFVNLWWLSLIFILIGAVILTTHSGTEIDHQSKTYRVYNSILFLRYGEKEKYDRAESIFINASKVSQTVHPAHTLDSATFEHIEYDAYLKFSNGKKIFLMSKKNKGQMMNKLRPVAEVIGVALIDYTE